MKLRGFRYRLSKPVKKDGSAFGKHGIKEVEYQYHDIYNPRKVKRTGAILTGKTLIGY